MLLFFLRVYLRDRCLGPLLFNIFLNDLFYFINRANLSNYADDNQIYFSDRDPEVVKSVIVGLTIISLRSIPRNVNVLFFQKTILAIFPLALVMYRFLS